MDSLDYSVARCEASHFQQPTSVLKARRLNFQKLLQEIYCKMAILTCKETGYTSMFL